VNANIDTAASSPPLILLVDDDVLILKLLARVLEAAGFRVCTASTGEQALGMLTVDGLQPQLAVLDITMPGMSGLELAGHLANVPYMFLSANDSADIAEQAAAEGAVGFLLKPIDPVRLVPTVRAALARGAEIQELRAEEQRLTQALREGRETGMAVGVLMERFRLDRHAALRMLRNHARSQQRKLNEVAVELLQSAETLNVVGMPK
jgi:response regulator NasT